MTDGGRQELAHVAKTLATIVTACAVIATTVFGIGAWVLDVKSAASAAADHAQLSTDIKQGDASVRASAHAELREAKEDIGDGLEEIKTELREERKATNGRLDAIYQRLRNGH